MRRAVVIFSLALAAAAARAGDIPELRHNPFDRPELPAPDDGPAATAATGWPESLRATLVDGARALANLDGQFLAVGDELAGVRVVAIGEGSVTLVHGDETRTLSVHPEETEDEDE